MTAADPRVLPAAHLAEIAAREPTIIRYVPTSGVPTEFRMAQLRHDELAALLAHAEALGAALATARKHAVSAIYFDDSSDFGSALWDVVRALDPEMADLLESDERAAFEKSRALSGSPPTGETR